MLRPQRERRVPSRFRGAEETSFGSKASGVTSLPKSVSQAPDQNRPRKKRRTGAAQDQAPQQQSTCNAAEPQAETRSLVAKTTVEDATASGRRASCNLAAPSIEAERDSTVPQVESRRPSVRPAVVQCDTSSDSSDVIMVEHRPSVTPTSRKSGGEVKSTLLNTTLGRPRRSSPPDVAALCSSPVPPLLPPEPVPKSPQCTRPKAHDHTPETTPKEPDQLPPTSDEPVSDEQEDVRKSVSSTSPPVTPAPLSAGSALASRKDDASLASAQFQPLFDREDTPPRPDFAENAGAGSDSDSDDGLDILAPRGRKGNKAAARRGQRGSLRDPTLSPSASTPSKSAQGTPAQRPLPANDTSWLPSPDVTRGGGGGAAESAALLMLRQQRAELLALACGASLASDRIQAQSAAEARLREQECERAAMQKEAEATARAEAVVAAALRAGQPQEDSDDAADEAAKVEEVAASIVVKVRASNGSQERFKIRSAEPFEKLFRAYLRKTRSGAIPAGAAFSFRFDGDPISDKQTPEELGLEDDDMIEVIRSK